jgi:2,3-bisphosphoglycerate-independent phosphoglycerate mutase
MADNPLPELGGRTPLETAAKPFLDDLAEHGTVGSVQTIPAGYAPGSDTAIMPIFGCDPHQCYSGRAPLELAAGGIVMPEGSAAYRCNMVSLEDGDMPLTERRIISHSAGSIEGDESDALVKALFAHPDFAPLAEAAGLTVYPGSSFRHLAIQKNADITGIVLAPPHDHLNEVCGPLLPAGCPNAAVLRGLMEKAFELLNHHPINEKRRAEGKLPANCIWFWAEGKGAKLPNFTAVYGADGGVVSAVPLCHGIARLVGLEPISVPNRHRRMGHGLRSQDKSRAGCSAFPRFRRIHLEGPDEATHNTTCRIKFTASSAFRSASRNRLSSRSARGARTSACSFSPTTRPTWPTAPTAATPCPS